MQEFVGRVTKGPFGRGSKSERDAIYLETPDQAYVLRRVGGNPLHDPQLEALVGKTIQCRGEASQHTLIIAEFRVLEQ